MVRCVRVMVALLICQGLASRLRAQSPIDRIRAANAGSQAAVSTILVRLEAKRQFPADSPFPNAQPNVPFQIEYWRSGDRERILELSGPYGVRDIIRNPGIHRLSTFIAAQGAILPTAVVTRSDDAAVDVRPWNLGLMHLPECSKSLSELLDTVVAKVPEKRAINGHQCDYLDLKDEKGRRFEVWADPSANYLVRKVVASFVRGSGKVVEEGEVESFREIAPGVFFPVRMSRTLSINGPWLLKQDCTVTQIDMKSRFDSGVFIPKYPSGTRVTDHVDNKTYIVDAKGKPEHVGAFDPAAFAGSFDSREPAPAPTPSDADDRRWPWHRVLLYICVIVAVASLPVAIWRRWKRGID